MPWIIITKGITSKEIAEEIAGTTKDRKVFKSKTGYHVLAFISHKCTICGKPIENTSKAMVRHDKYTHLACAAKAGKSFFER